MTDGLVYLDEGLPGIPEKLMLARDRGEVLFLTGAGVSTPPPSNLPGFRGLVAKIAERLDARLGEAMAAWMDAAQKDSAGPPPSWKPYAGDLDARQQAELKRFVGGEFDLVLGMLERRMIGTEDGVSRLRQAATQVLDAAKAPNVLHSALNSLARRYGDLFVATTNFDLLHELAAKKPKPPSYGLEGLPRPSRAPSFHGVFHIHGKLEAGRAGQLVLTDQDFGDLYLRRRLTADFVYDAARIFNIVIIGYSVNDPPFRYLMNAVAGDSLHFPDLRDRYVFAPRPAGDRTIEEDWSARSIVPICYDEADSHAELARLLSAWAESVPTVGEDDWARKKLRKICRRPRDEADQSELSVFTYIFRRALGTEQAALSRHMGELGAHPSWLDEANIIIRDRRSVS